jgi:hypothetical protein
MLFLMMHGILVATQFTEALSNLAVSHGRPNPVTRSLGQGDFLLVVLQSSFVIP